MRTLLTGGSILFAILLFPSCAKRKAPSPPAQEPSPRAVAPQPALLKDVSNLTYICPKPSCEYSQKGPGRYAKCKDKHILVPAKEGLYYCPMHPERVAEGPAKCPDCGMDMVPSKGKFYCPMHPEYTSNEPGSKCPVCGMKMVERGKG